jgi:hypothetical protein
MDVHLIQVFHGDLHALVPPALSYTLAWIFEAFETFLILTLLGAGLRFSEVMPIESSLATIRVFAFFVPAGLGIQDVGYVLFLKALGVHDATSVGASFVLLKRAKETFWILVGYLLMAREPKNS